MKYNANGTPRGAGSDYGSDARADIKLKPCDRCRLRGHYCEAQTIGDDEEPLCVFCADGVTCLHERVDAKKRAAAPAKLGPEILRDAIAEAKRPEGQPRKPRNPNSPWRGNAGLILSNKAPQRPPSATPAEPEAKKETIMKARAPRMCACKPGCPEIAKSNASPYAKGHNPNAKKPASRRATPPPAN